MVCELQGKLDSLTAKVGDRVVLKTRDKVLTSDGTVIPSGARFVGHVTQVETYDPDRGPALIAIAFDHVEMKNGQSIAVYTLIRGLMQASMMNRGANEERWHGRHAGATRPRGKRWKDGS